MCCLRIQLLYIFALLLQGFPLQPIQQCSSQSWKTTGRTNLHKLIFIVNPRWRRYPTRITTWCTKFAPPFALIGRFLQLQAQNNADESPKKPKGSRKMTGRWKNDRALRKNDRALNKTTGRCALSFRPSENPDTVANATNLVWEILRQKRPWKLWLDFTRTSSSDGKFNWIFFPSVKPCSLVSLSCRPSLFDYDNIYGCDPITCCEHAFTVAHEHLGVEHLLDPEGITSPSLLHAVLSCVHVLDAYRSY